jgi:ABC-type antimicrobial peptide transport system permease subunit
MALGARTRQVLFMILRESSWLAILGIAAGLIAAIALTRFVSSMLYGLKPSDPTTLIAATLILLAVAIAAAYVPAHRASRIDPMQALRHE